MTHNNYDGVDLVTPKSAGLLLLYHTVNIDDDIYNIVMIWSQLGLLCLSHNIHDRYCDSDDPTSLMLVKHSLQCLLEIT